jgi:hypothetical protein
MSGERGASTSRWVAKGRSGRTGSKLVEAWLNYKHHDLICVTEYKSSVLRSFYFKWITQGWPKGGAGE